MGCDVNVWSQDPCLEESDAASEGVAAQKEEQTVGVQDQTVFTLVDFIVPNSASLAIYLNGRRQIEGITEAYIMASTTQVTFTSGLDLDDKLTFVLNELDADAAASVAAAIAAAESAEDSAALATEAAIAAAEAAAAVAIGEVVEVTFTDSPLTIVSNQDGNIFTVDTSGGDVVVNLPKLSLEADDFFISIIKETGDTNSITVQRQGTDTINGVTSHVNSDQWKLFEYMGDQSSGAYIVNASADTVNIVDDTTPQAGGNFDMNDHQMQWSKGADVDSASTLPVLTDGNYFDVTGSNDIDLIASTGGAGTLIKLHFDDVLTINHHATDLVLPNGANLTTFPGAEAEFIEYEIGDYRYVGGTLVAGGPQIQPITASVAANALTLTLNSTALDFRSSTLGSGAVNTRTVGSAISVVVSSGSTLETINAKQSRLVVIAIDNAGTVELAVVNIAGGNNLDEATLISTTAEGGAGGADSNDVIYSTTARTNVPFRVVGFVESTQATAGTWATAPSTIQGAGGNAVTAMSSIGYGQTWQNVSGSRSSGVTYYNTTGRPILISVAAGAALTSSVSISVNGVVAAYTQTADAGNNSTIGTTCVVPASASYVVTLQGAVTVWSELR